MQRPRLAITVGDPAGVGPETIVGVWPDTRVHRWCRPFVVGHPQIIRRAVELLHLPITVREIDSPAQAESTPSVIDCLRTGSDAVLGVAHCTVDARSGQAAYDALVAAARMALAGEIDGLVTAPLHKAALWQAGHHYPGHTELLAELCGVEQFAMMLYLGHDSQIVGSAGLGVAHVTLHMALREVFSHLNEASIVGTAQLLDEMMRKLKRASTSGTQSTGGTSGTLAPRLGAVRLGIAALNPHAGESGLFGDEEERIIRPAVERMRALGIDAEGPLSTDTLMVAARDGKFDGVVAMYHDQGHIALKLLGMHRAVNVTLGLPIVRTSVAHGTAFDLAWQGRAETSSMIEAIRVGAVLAGEGRNRNGEI